MQALKTRGCYVVAPMVRYLDLSCAFGGYGYGYRPRHFTKRAKNALKNQILLSAGEYPIGKDHGAPSSTLSSQWQRQQGWSFIRKASPFIEAYPYLYLSPFWGDGVSKFNGPRSFFEPVDALLDNSILNSLSSNFLWGNPPSDSLLQGEKEEALVSENFIFFNCKDSRILLTQEPGAFFVRQIQHLSLLEVFEQLPRQVWVCPGRSLLYPVYNLIFSKSPLPLPSLYDEGTRILYRDALRFARCPSHARLEKETIRIVEKDLMRLSPFIKEKRSFGRFFRIELQEGVLEAPFQGRIYGGYGGKHHSFLASGNKVYLGIPLVNNPAIFSKKVRWAIQASLKPPQGPQA